MAVDSVPAMADCRWPSWWPSCVSQTSGGAPAPRVTIPAAVLLTPPGSELQAYLAWFVPFYFYLQVTRRPLHSCDTRKPL